MDDTSQENLKEQLLAQIPIDGTSVGNAALRTALGWDLGQYQTIRDQLVRDGLIEPWRGRGGTVRRTRITDRPKPESLKTADVEQEEKDALSKRRMLEAKLYPPLLGCLRLWASDQGWTDHIVHQLSHRERRNTGGAWTRPDFVVIGYRKFEYTPGILRDLETFEVKTSACGIDAVYETAAQSRVATKSYLIIHRTNEGPAIEDLDRIESECVRFGVGLILFTDPKNYETWEYRVEPKRHEPDPFDIEEFVQTQVPSTDQERIRKWLR